MALDRHALERDKPQLYSLVKEAEYSLIKRDLDPSKYKAAVIATVDHSGSTEQPGRRLYSNGTMQKTVDIAFAAGLLFDDDGEIPLSLFDDGIDELGNMNLGNCRKFMDRHQRYTFGGTNYVGALRWIVKEAGYGQVDLGTLRGGNHGHHVSVNPSMSTPRDTGRHWWGSKKAPASQPRMSTPSAPVIDNGLRVRATAEYPTFACFITDGEPQDSQQGIRDYLTLMSQLPIFVQFIGVGDANFDFLSDLDEMDGRFVDNANFFDAKDVGHDQGKMLDKMLGEFPDYYKKAISLGLVTPIAA